MNFFYSIPSTCYIHIAYYPKEKKKEKNIISHPCKEGRVREREMKRKKESRKSIFMP